MVIKALLKGSINGVGKYHKTPIFPCGIFQCKEGVNRHEGDPNYDLFRLALKSTAQRIYPNYANADVSMQKNWVKTDREQKQQVIDELTEDEYKVLIKRIKNNPSLGDKLFLDVKDGKLIVQQDEKPFEIFSTMGCVDGEEVITYKFNGQLFVESFRRMWLRLTDYFVQQEQIDGVHDHLYMDVNGVEIYDSQNGFVNVKRVIRNTSNSWVELKLSKGRLLKCTNNHPLPTNRGVICAENLQKGDILYSSKKQPNTNDLTYSTDKAWLLGFIMCDGCYDGYVTSTIAFNGEDDIQEAYIDRMYNAFSNKVKVKEQHRSHKGDYKELICTEKNTWFIDYLSTKFEGLTKNRRHIPNEVFLWSKEARLSFLAGIIDADGYINPTTHGGSVVQIGSVNKELSLQQLALVLSLDMDGCVYKNEFNKQKGSVHYRVEFHPTEELLDYIVCKKKTDNFIGRKALSATVDNTLGQDLTVYDIIFTNGDNYSYDVETESGYFDVSGIWSHNCRTVNGADVNAQISYRINIQSVIKDGTIKDTILSAAQKDGRGNICPVTIILPTLAMEAERDKAKFMKLLDKKISEAKDMLIERFEWICKQSPMSAKFMWENNTMSGYIPDEGTRSALRHGTIVIGQIGIAETLQLLLGTDHTTEEGMALAKEIEELFKTRCAEFKEQYKLNFGVYYTPAENLCHTALKNFRAKYGIIENVSDREYFTNSIHVPVWKDMTPFEKVDIESQLTGFSSAGCITYVELEHGVKHNVDAMEEIVSYAMDHDIPYFAINVPIDDCNDCGYSDEISEVCPQCGSENISRLRRCTGYLSGDYKSSFNQGKQEEVEHRVKHIKEIIA